MQRFVALLLLSLFAAAPAHAETRNVDYSQWSMIGNTVYTRYTVPASEAKFVVPPNSKRPADKILAEYLLAHVSVSRDGEDCEAIDQGQEIGQINTLAFTPGRYLFEIQYLCGAKGAVSLSNTAFAEVPAHTNFARVQMSGGDFVQHVFTAGAPRFDLPNAPDDLRSDSMFRYGVLGFLHVTRSLDILLFMAAIFLVARARRDYVFAACGLGLGYVLALLASVCRLTIPHLGSGVPFNALLVFLAAASALVLRQDHRRNGIVTIATIVVLAVLPAVFLHNAAGAAASLAMTLAAVSTLWLPNRAIAGSTVIAVSCFVFALLDGFVLASDVSVLAIPGWSLMPMALGFDAGAWLTEMALPVCLAIAWLFVPRVKRQVPQDGFLADATAAVFLSCGIFWFLTRLYA